MAGDRGLGDMLLALVSLARTGWMLDGVPARDAETVAEHLFAAAVIALELGERLKARGLRVSPERAAALALAHDLAESVIGDVTRRAVGLSEAKRRAEAEAYESLPLSPGVKRLYREFEEEASLEALVARASELLATAWRAKVYIARGYRVERIMESTLREALRVAEKGGFRGDLERLAEDLGVLP